MPESGSLQMALSNSSESMMALTWEPSTVSKVAYIRGGLFFEEGAALEKMYTQFLQLQMKLGLLLWLKQAA
jgi:hypothetical protein